MIAKAWIGALVAALMSVTVARAEEQLTYEPDVVKLTGVIQSAPVPEYAYESAATPRPSRYVFLRLDAPITVIGKPESDTNTETFKHVKRVQLAYDPEKMKLGQRVGRRATLEGTLYAGFNIHHFTDVLLYVNRVVTIEDRKK